MFDFLKRIFGHKQAEAVAPYKIEPQVHSTDAVHDAVFVTPPAPQPKKSGKKPAGRTGSTTRKPAAKKS